MWATKVVVSWRNVMALAGTAAPARTALGVQPAILGFPQFGTLRARVRQRHGRILADGEFALATLEHVVEGPAPATPFDLELQPLAVTVLAALQAGDGFGGERVLLEHRLVTRFGPPIITGRYRVATSVFTRNGKNYPGTMWETARGHGSEADSRPAARFSAVYQSYMDAVEQPGTSSDPHVLW